MTVESNGRVEELRPRLVVAADGRSSMARKWCGFETVREPDRYYMAGLLLEGIRAPEDAGFAAFNPVFGRVGFLFPQGGGRARAYTVYPVSADFRLSGDATVPRFVSEAVSAGVPADYYEGARAIGPLASFITADHWIETLTAREWR